MERKLIFYTFFYFSSLMLVRVCGILAKILLARSITPYEFGLITLLVLTIPNIMQILTNFCFYDILGHATEGKKYLGFSLVYGTITTVILAIIFYIFHVAIFTYLNIPQEFWAISYTIIFIVLFTVTIRGVITGYLRGIRNHVYAATLSAEPPVLRVVLTGCAVYLLGIDNFYVILIIFALPPLITLIPIILFKSRELIASLRSMVIPNYNMFYFGLSFYILNLWMGLTQMINLIVISHDLGVTWSGYFDVSLSAVAVITFFASAIYLVSVPETSTKNNRTEMLSKRGGFGDIGKFLFSMCLLCVIIIYSYSYQIITLLFTEKYAVASDYLIILAIGYAVLFIQQFCAFLTISAEREKGLSRISWVTVISLVIFPFFTHFMILYFNFIGAYLATTIFIIFYTLATIVLIKDRTPLMLLLVKIERLALSVFGTFLIMHLLHFSLIPGIFTSLVVFTSLIFMLGYIDKNIVWDMIQIKIKNV